MIRKNSLDATNTTGLDSAWSVTGGTVNAEKTGGARNRPRRRGRQRGRHPAGGAVVDADPWITAYVADRATRVDPGFWPLYGTIAMQTSLTPDEVVTMNTLVTSGGVYGMQLRVHFDPTELEFVPAAIVAPFSYHNVPLEGWFWDNVAENFIAVPLSADRRLSGSLTNVPHPDAATLTGGSSVATWQFKCLKAGDFALTYDATLGKGTYLATKNGFKIPTTLTGGTVHCSRRLRPSMGTSSCRDACRQCPAGSLAGRQGDVDLRERHLRYRLPMGPTR